MLHSPSIMGQTCVFQRWTLKSFFGIPLNGIVFIDPARAG